MDVGEGPEKDKAVELTNAQPPERAGLRLQHIMFLIVLCAVVLWIGVTAGPWLLGSALFLMVAGAVGLGVVLVRWSSTQRESLLWALAIASERSMPLSEAALAFSDQFTGVFRAGVEIMAEMLRRGAPLPEAMGSLFPRDVDLLVRIGDATGTLPQALHRAATSRSTHQTAWASVALRFAYLGWVLIVIQLLSAFIMYFIVPKFEAIFKDFGISLPEVTIQVIRASHFLIMYFYLVLPPLVLFELFLFLGAPLALFGVFRFNVPFLDSLFRRRHTTLILRALALTAEGGKPITTGLAVLASDYPSSWVRGRLVRVKRDVEQGSDWAESLSDHGLIQPLDEAVLKSAQRVGNLAWALEEMAASNDRRLGYRLQLILQLLFPVTIIGIGALVFVFAVAYFSPLVKLIERLSG